MKRAFTLVEVLVTLGIVAVLAVIVIPSLGMARARADSAKCMANLRNLGAGLNAYLGDHEMKMPVLAAARADKTEEAAVLDNTLNTYLEDPRVFTCPAGRAQAEKTGTSYYWNSALNGQPLAALQFLWFTDLSKIPLIVDKEGWHQHTDDKVNHLFADGHVTNQLRFAVE